MPVVRERKGKDGAREKRRRKEKKAQGCLQALDRTGPDQTGRQAGRQGPTNLLR